MWWNSFRTRFAVTSALLSALVLASFAVPTWMLMYRVSIKRLDLVLEEDGKHQMRRITFAGFWQSGMPPRGRGRDISSEYGFALLARDRSGRTIYQSPHWPRAVSLHNLPSPGPFPKPLPPPPFAEPPRYWERPVPRGLLRAKGKDFSVPSSKEHKQPETDRPRLFRSPPPPPPPPRAHFVTRRVGMVQWRIGAMSTPWGSLYIGTPVFAFATEMRSLRNAFLLALPAALLLVGISGWWLSERALRPVGTLADKVAGITAKGLHQRLPDAEEDVEFHRLTTAFNDMLDRLERSFHQAVRFSADAAHELKTPLTVLQGELEVAVQSAPNSSEQQQTFGALLEEVQRLKAIVQKLLLLSRADAGQLILNLTPLNLSAAADALCDDLEIIAPHLTLDKEIAPDVWVAADTDLLRQTLSNLVSNAVKHNRDDGLVILRLRCEGPRVVFEVSNTGPEISPDDREHIFDRFFRADPARTRGNEGLGLGLSIAREIAWAHGGDLRLSDSANGLTTFELLLPLAPPAGQPSGVEVTSL